VLILVLAGATVQAPMHAQQREPKPPAVARPTEMAVPAPEMVKRQWVVGTWNVTETHEKSDWSPGGIGKGTSVIRPDPVGTPR
jgi:hypothetical protein